MRKSIIVSLLQGRKQTIRFYLVGGTGPGGGSSDFAMVNSCGAVSYVLRFAYQCTLSLNLIDLNAQVDRSEAESDQFDWPRIINIRFTTNAYE